MSDLLTVPEVAEKLRKSEWFITKELREKNLRGSKVGREWLISPDDIESYLAARANVTAVRKRSP